MSTPEAPPTEPNEDPCTDFCSLPTEEVRERAAMIRSELVPQVVDKATVPGGLAWQFENRPGMRKKLDEFVEFERRCCAGMAFEVIEIDDARRIRLTITGEGADVIAALAQDAPDVAAAGGAAKILKAGGLGVGVSVFVCCLLPIGVGAVAGAAVAAPLATLDSPLYIGVGGLLASIATWFYMTRREKAVCSDGC